jgi:hypothetical protein
MLLTSSDRHELYPVTSSATRATVAKPYDLAAVAERIRAMISR